MEGMNEGSNRPPKHVFGVAVGEAQNEEVEF